MKDDFDAVLRVLATHRSVAWLHSRIAGVHVYNRNYVIAIIIREGRFIAAEVMR
jgi:hypothetical protein